MSKIEWTEKTWNPIVGCSVVSPGCTNCYAMTMAARLERMGMERYRGLTKPSKAGPVWTGETRFVEETLTEPLRRRKPTMWFVNSMSDLFHESVPDEWIDRVFAVMALCPQHTFQVLTKRSARMRAYLTRPAGDGKQDVRNHLAWNTVGTILNSVAPNWGKEPIDGKWRSRGIGACTVWPLPNVWLGVSTEDQRRADGRVPDLLATPAAVRFVSAEPLLGPIDFTEIEEGCARRDIPLEYWEGAGDTDDEPPGVTTDALAGREHQHHGHWSGDCARLDWIIVGKESSHGARWIDDDAVRLIRDQCESAGTAFFYKQDARNGRKIPTPELDGRRWVGMPEVRV